MSDPTVKFCLDHPQKWLQTFQVSGKGGRFGLVKPGHLPNFSPICLFLGGTFKIDIDIAKKKVRTFLNSTMFRGVLWTPSHINSPWWNWRCSKTSAPFHDYRLPSRFRNVRLSRYHPNFFPSGRNISTRHWSWNISNRVHTMILSWKIVKEFISDFRMSLSMICCTWQTNYTWSPSISEKWDIQRQIFSHNIN